MGYLTDDNSQAFKKVTSPPKMHVKNKYFGTCFICLKGSLDMFRKIHKVCNFDSFGLKVHVESNLGYNRTYCQHFKEFFEKILETLFQNYSNLT